ncbi:Tctex-1 [Hyaloraphidium curvatum]|nr:Tctex-1 [Hyaloraphidium curvatum]
MAAPEPKGFSPQEVDEIIKEAVEATIQNAQYNYSKVAQWNSNIVEQTLKRLAGLNRPYKYVVTCLIMQRNGAGLHCASSCFWDNSTDGSTTYRWENKSMHVIVHVFGLAI